MNVETFNKFNNFMTQHVDKVPLLSVGSTEDKRFTVLREFLTSLYGDVEDNAWSVSANLGKFVDDLSTLEPIDRARVVNSVKKYQVKGENYGIHGQRTYGFDKSRVDQRLIKRKRSN